MDYFKADAVSGQDYDPFGMVRPNRSASDDGYRFGFNGKEKDSEFSNESYDFGARIYDGRVARWLSVDPIHHANMSPFVGINNNPIYLTDPKGTTAGDYISKQTGVPLGSDNQNDGKIYYIERKSQELPLPEDAPGVIKGSEYEKLKNDPNYTTTCIATIGEVKNVIAGAKPIHWATRFKSDGTPINPEDNNPEYSINTTAHNPTLNATWTGYDASIDGKPCPRNDPNPGICGEDPYRCLNLVQSQCVVAGFKPGVYGSGTFITKANFFTALSNIHNTLSMGIPVILGVDDPGTYSNPSGADHFITVVGCGRDSKGIFFSFYENAVVTEGECINLDPKEGNRIYLSRTDPYTVSGSSTWGEPFFNIKERINVTR